MIFKYKNKFIGRASLENKGFRDLKIITQVKPIVTNIFSIKTIK